MDKLLTYSGYDQTGPHIFPIEADVEKSLGLIKLARALPPKIEQHIREAKPIDGKSQLLIDALGADEYWGSNVNGDAFPEEALRHTGPDYGHETFEHYAYPYKNHCFPAGTLVLMADRTRRPIEEVRVGDVVVTLDGNHPVTAIMNRPYDGPGIRVWLRGEYDPLVGTIDHPVQVFRRNQIHCHCRYSRLTKTGHESDCVEYRKTIGDPEWIPLSAVLPGDYMVLPRPHHGSKAVAPEFARLVGWVAAEGYLGKHGIIQFTFAQDGPDIDQARQCLQENGLSVNVTPRPQYGTVILTACSKDMHAMLSEYIVGVLSEKHITNKILEWDADSLLWMLRTYIDGDGHVPSHGKNDGQLRIRSSSPSMLYILSDVIRSLEIPATSQWDSEPREMISPTNGKKYWTHGSGVIAVSREHSPFIARSSRKHFIHQMQKKSTVTLLGDVFLMRVTDCEEILLNEEVFNLEVSGPNHYTAGEVIVHNCNKDPARAYGDRVKLASYDDQMHRVLLIVVIENEKCQDILNDLGNGHYWDVSMGCRVPWDECSVCKNRARNRGEYCPHLRMQMNQILPDGRRVKAYNHRPKFHDISFVPRGAEKASHILKKVAHVGQVPTSFLSSAEAGELYYGKWASQSKTSTEKKEADIDKSVPTNIKPSPESVKAVDDLVDNAGYVKSHEHPLPGHVLDALSQFPLGEIASTLTALGIPLRPEEFQRIVLIKLGEAKLAQKLASSGMVFDEYKVSTKNPSWSSELEQFDLGSVSEKVAQILRPYVASRSCYPEALAARLDAMEKAGGFGLGQDPDFIYNKQWQRQGDGNKQPTKSLISPFATAGIALATGFMLLKKQFPQLAEKGPLRLLAKHPWLIPILLAGGVGAAAGLSSLLGPRSLTDQPGLLDGMNSGKYDAEKTAALKLPWARLGLIPLAYIYSGIQQRRAEKGIPLGSFNRFLAARPDLAAVGAIVLSPTIGRGIAHISKHAGVMGDLATYTIGSPSKFIPGVLAGALLDSLIFRGISRLASSKPKELVHANAR